MRYTLFALLVVLSITPIAAAQAGPQGEYAEVNGLKMYYEIHGEGKPLVLLHGGFGTAERWAMHLPLIAGRRVILIEQQGHGHTADRDEPLRYEQMADDTAALLGQLKIEKPDIFGYSDGGTVGLCLAVRHPEAVGKLVVLGASAGALKDTYDPVVYQQFLALPDNFAPPRLKEPYDRVAPDKSKWPVLVRKLKELGRDFAGLSDADLKGIKAPTLIMQGDRDMVKPEHAVHMMQTIPGAQLAIFPGADHFVLYTDPKGVMAAAVKFFDGGTAGGHE